MKVRNIVIGVALALVGLLAVGLAVGGRWLGWTCAGYGSGVMGRWGLPFGMHTFGGGILMLLFWGLLLGGGALLVAALARQGTRPVAGGESSLEILKRRYASGEIDREEFERMRESLSG